MGYMSGVGWVMSTSRPGPKLWELGEGRGSHLDQVTREGVIGDHCPRLSPLPRRSTQVPLGD